MNYEANLTKNLERNAKYASDEDILRIVHAFLRRHDRSFTDIRINAATGELLCPDCENYVAYVETIEHQRGLGTWTLKDGVITGSGDTTKYYDDGKPNSERFECHSCTATFQLPNDNKHTEWEWL